MTAPERDRLEVVPRQNVALIPAQPQPNDPLVSVLTPEQLAESWRRYRLAGAAEQARTGSFARRLRARRELRRPTWVLQYPLG